MYSMLIIRKGMKMAQNKVKAKGMENYMNMSIVGIIGQTTFICLTTYCI